ncbi:hypothetical protein SUGI_1109970 [Cryptomeria japonica]|nr:hypothetical protein SUGI_1109970 [Cryptomeria japonica]
MSAVQKEIYLHMQKNVRSKPLIKIYIISSKRLFRKQQRMDFQGGKRMRSESKVKESTNNISQSNARQD